MRLLVDSASARKGTLMRAIVDWLRSVWMGIVAMLSARTRKNYEDPETMRASYDRLAETTQADALRATNAVATLKRISAEKTASHKNITLEMTKIAEAMEGTISRAKDIADALKASGKTADEVKADSQYQECLADYEKYESTLTELRNQAQLIEASIQDNNAKIDKHTETIKKQVEEARNLSQEGRASAAAVQMAKIDQEMTALQGGLNGSSERNRELEKLRQVTAEAAARVEITNSIVGKDDEAKQDKYRDYARNKEKGNAFDKLVGV